MAENNLARSRNQAPDFFADDDPLAELARIVGYDDRPAAKPAAQQNAAPRHDPVFNLEEELLREFERYDAPAPHLDPANDMAFDLDQEAGSVLEAQSADPVAPVYPVEAEELVFVPQEAASFDRMSDEGDHAFGDAEPAIAPETSSADREPLRQDPVFDTLQDDASAAEVAYPPLAPVYAEPTSESFDLAAELETAIGVSSEVADVAPVAAAPVADDIVTTDARPAMKRKEAYVPGFRMPIANFNPQRDFAPAARAPAPRTEPEAPAAPIVEAAPVVATELAQPAARPVMPIAQPAAAAVAAAPKFSAMDELIYDVERYSLSGAAAKPLVVSPVKAEPIMKAEPVVVAPTMSIAQTITAAAPVKVDAVAANAVTDEVDPFGDDDFEIALDDFELDLADIVIDDEVKPQVGAPIYAAPAAAPVSLSQAPIAQAPVAQAYVANAPVAPTQVTPVRVEPVATAPEPESTADLPFDPAMIADSDDHPEALADLNVPALPAEEPEEQIAYRPDYDLDIDAELATLLLNPAQDASSPARPAAPAKVVAPAAAASAPVEWPPQATRSTVNADLDEFERALEEDFRRSLATPLPASDHERYADVAGYQGNASRAGSQRSARSWAMPLAMIGVVVLAGAGGYAWLGSGTSGPASNGEPVVIAADNDPIKVAPEHPGGKTVPNQDKAVYDRVAGAAQEDPKQTTLISSNEEPVDVVQKTLIPESMPIENEGDFELASTPVGETEDPRLLPNQNSDMVTTASADRPVAVMPRKVKTMIVRPDGSLVEQEITSPAVASIESEKIPAAAAKQAEVASIVAPTAAALPASINPSSAGVLPVSAPVIETIETDARARAPVPGARPSAQPVNVVASVSDQGNVRPNPTAQQPTAAAPAQAATQVASLGPNDFVIQIASLPSQAEAQKSYQNLSSKFGSVIGGRGVDIKQAEIAGKGTFYRVRIPAGSKAEAVTLCERYRSAGGSCLVAK